MRGFTRTSIAVVALSLAACATEPTNNFTFASSDVRTSTTAPLQEPVQEYAGRMRDDRECRNEVIKLAVDSKDEDRAWELLQACVVLNKFRDLEMVLRRPFFRRVELMGRYESARLLTHLIALRGGDLRRDLKLLEKAGVSLSPLESACDQPRLYMGHFVAFRGRVVRDGTTKSKVKFAEVDMRTARLYSDVKGRQPTDDVSKGLTGRIIIAAIEGNMRQRIRPENEYIAVGILDNVRGFVEGGEPKQQAQMTLIDAFESAPPGRGPR